MSSKSHIRIRAFAPRSRRVRVPARRRAPPRLSDATRTKKIASRDVADADPRPRASFARAVPSLSLFPRATLASRAEAARRARVSRGRDAASSRSRDDAVGRPTTRAREARSRGGRRPSIDDSSERGKTRARSPDASTGLDRRTASCERSMASRRGRAVESSSRRPSRTRARLVFRLVPHHRLSAVRESINHS
jgi:hypothetical protein